MHRDAGSTSAAIDAFLEPFRAVERRDPHWGTAHLAAAMAWISCLGASNAAEGITFGILCGIAATRLPSTIGLYPGLLRTRVMLVFLLVLAWRALSVAWSANPSVGWGSEISRFSLLPLALWPLAHRFGILAATGIAAATAISALLLGLNASSEGLARYTEARTLGKEVGMTAACLVAALLLASLLPCHVRLASALPRLGAVLAITAGLSVLSQRSSFLASAGGMLVGFALAIPRVQARHRRWIALALVATLGTVGVASALNPRIVDWVGRVRTAVDSQEFSSRTWNDVTAVRGPLAEIALEMARDRPVLGYGSRGFAAECTQRCERRLREDGDAAAPFQSIPGHVTSHNFLLDELCMRGSIGLALILALVTILAKRSIRDPGSTACAAMLAAWVIYGFADAATGRGTHIAILAIVVARCAWIEASGAAGLPRAAAR